MPMNYFERQRKTLENYTKNKKKYESMRPDPVLKKCRVCGREFVEQYDGAVSPHCQRTKGTCGSVTCIDRANKKEQK